MVNYKARGTGIFKVIIKSTDQDKTTDTTFADDDELKVTLPVGDYYIRIGILLKSTTNPDFKWEVASTGTMAGYCNYQSQDGGTPSATIAIDANRDVTTTAAVMTLDISVHVVVTATGVLSFQWAQQTSHADTTRVMQDSAMVVFQAS